MSTITIEIADRTARDLQERAAKLDMSVGELVDAMAGQFLSDAPVELTDEQVQQIRRNMDDPRPSQSHDQVVARIDRMIADKP